jgi:hypothetical protein
MGREPALAASAFRSRVPMAGRAGGAGGVRLSVVGEPAQSQPIGGDGDTLSVPACFLALGEKAPG